MKHLRLPAILLTILYSSLVLGMNFHSHGREQQMSVHCKICDFSQTFSSQPQHFHTHAEVSRLGTVPTLISQQAEPDLIRTAAGRSPPLS